MGGESLLTSLNDSGCGAGDSHGYYGGSGGSHDCGHRGYDTDSYYACGCCGYGGGGSSCYGGGGSDGGSSRK